MFFNMEKGVFLIDGGYLSFISKFLGGGKHLKFKIENFVLNIFRRINLDCEFIYYYTAPPYQNPNPNEDEKRRRANYDKFIKKLKEVEIPKIIIKEGRCQKTDTDFCQKGVDTLITMDLMKLTKEANVKNIVLLTSDTDFVPIIQDIKKNNNTNVILVYFTDKKRKSPFSLSNYLWEACNRRVLIKLEDFK